MQDITVQTTKVCIVKVLVFPAVHLAMEAAPPERLNERNWDARWLTVNIQAKLWMFGRHRVKGRAIQDDSMLGKIEGTEKEADRRQAEWSYL